MAYNFCKKKIEFTYTDGRTYIGKLTKLNGKLVAHEFRTARQAVFHQDGSVTGEIPYIKRWRVVE